MHTHIKTSQIQELMLDESNQLNGIYINTVISLRKLVPGTVFEPFQVL